MFDNWTPWTWVSIAWLQLVLAYGGYLYYLNARGQQLIVKQRDNHSIGDQP